MMRQRYHIPGSQPLPLELIRLQMGCLRAKPLGIFYLTLALQSPGRKLGFQKFSIIQTLLFSRVTKIAMCPSVGRGDGSRTAPSLLLPQNAGSALQVEMQQHSIFSFVAGDEKTLAVSRPV